MRWIDRIGCEVDSECKRVNREGRGGAVRESSERNERTTSRRTFASRASLILLPSNEVSHPFRVARSTRTKAAGWRYPTPSTGVRGVSSNRCFSAFTDRSARASTRNYTVFAVRNFSLRVIELTRREWLVSDEIEQIVSLVKSVTFDSLGVTGGWSSTNERRRGRWRAGRHAP